MDNTQRAAREVWVFVLCAVGWFAGLSLWLIGGGELSDHGFQAAVIAALSLLMHETYKPGGVANDRR